MSKYIKALMEREKNNQSVQKNIVDLIKDNIKNKKYYTTDYNFLQRNPNGSQECNTEIGVADFCKDYVEDIILPYYKDKQVTAGVNEFFQMYENLGENQEKEKAILAYNFLMANPDEKGYPFKYHTDRHGKKYPCGKCFGSSQADNGVFNEKKAKFPLEDFIHLHPFGYPEDEITKRIYINAPANHVGEITLELFKRCAEHPDDKNYQAYVKFHTADTRNDMMLAYCTEKNFDIMFDLVHEIYEEHKEWFNGTGKLPLMTNICDEKNNHLILGIADEPTVTGTSFNELFCDKIIEPFKKDLAKKFGIDDQDNLNKLPAEVIDKCVTYDALKPYIEKTCYSADYPFLTKDTVKKMQMQKTVANTQQATVQATQTEQVVENTQNHFQSLHDDKLAKDLTELGLV